MTAIQPSSSSACGRLRALRPRLADVFTAPNAISVAGFVLVLSGTSRIRTPRGLTSVVLGRASDLIDGTVARATGATSDFGAALDAALDKLGMAAILTSAFRQRCLPRPALLGVVVHNALNAGATLLQQRRRPDRTLRPTVTGKLSMFAENIGVLAHVAANLDSESVPDGVRRACAALGVVGTTLGIAGGLAAAAQYFHRALGTPFVDRRSA
jgi:phosphatidylglycerophosphate synthase